MPDEKNSTQTDSTQGFPAPDDLAENVCRKVKELRVERGWSLVELASRSGVSRSMLSQIERAKANPTLAVALRIAQAFGLSLGELVETPDGENAIEVIRADDPAFHYRSDHDCRIRTLSPLHLEKDVEFYELCLRAGSELTSAAHYEGTREFLTVEKGRVRVQSGDDTVELGPGDSASYRADVTHAITNAGSEEALLFLVDIYR